MTHQDTGTPERIRKILKTPHKFSKRGFYTPWSDWAGPANSIYIKVIKGKWRAAKKQKAVYEAWLSIRVGRWRGNHGGKPFDALEFSSFIRYLPEQKPVRKVKRQEARP